MPWCPKCKNEYVEGMTTCAECGVDLVAELPEEPDENMPVRLCHAADEKIGGKLIFYLNMQGFRTAGLMPVTEEDELYEDGFYVVVAGIEYQMMAENFKDYDEKKEITEEDIITLMPDIDEKLEELKDEEANQMLSELRTESSSVYVKKKDKYTDLKFSGISFIVFALLGFGLLALNVFDYISMFNQFSMLIMTAVFVIFFFVGITSLLRARKMRGIVSQEEKVSDDVLDWIEENITDEYIHSLTDPENTEEDNYFSAHTAMCNRVAEQFPLFNRNYIDQLMDDRYTEYCESASTGEEADEQNETEPEQGE